MTMKNFLLVLLTLIIFSMYCYCDVPNEIRYSGRLKNHNSVVNASINFNFKIYNQESDGTAIWESGNESIKVSSGLFSYVIKPDLNKVDLRKSNLWLQLVVDGKELSPREKFSSQLYSLHSLSAETLSANDEIVIKIGTSSVSIGIKNGKLCYKGANLETFSVPPGTIIAFAGNKIPNGYLLCDGSELEISKYPQLFEAIGTIYGGNASSRFKLPDFRGVFLRGVGGPNAPPLGQNQGDAIRNIRGSLVKIAAGGEFSATGAFRETGTAWTFGSGNASQYYIKAVSFDACNVVPTANENRPINYSVNYCIKY
jgi:microcystin-dependent protein